MLYVLLEWSPTVICDYRAIEVKYDDVMTAECVISVDKCDDLIVFLQHHLALVSRPSVISLFILRVRNFLQSRKE